MSADIIKLVCISPTSRGCTS